MRVKALKSFVSRIENQTYRLERGDEFDLPPGVDWLTAGLVEALPGRIETAAIAPERTAVKKTAAPRKPKAGTK